MLRDSDDARNLREYLIATAARLIDQRGSAGLAVRDIAREAQVADGVLYNYFEDKEDLLVHALLAHVGTVMAGLRPMPPAGTGTVAGNLRQFIDAGLEVLARVAPAFAGLLAQPKVLTRFHDMVGGARRSARNPRTTTRAGVTKLRTALAVRGCPRSCARTCAPSSSSAASTAVPTSRPRWSWWSARSTARSCPR